MEEKSNNGYKYKEPLKKLRNGYTTGTCAAAAARTAAFATFGECKESVEFSLAEGVKLKLNTKIEEIGNKFAVASIIKDSGDDPDITNGIKVYARVELMENSEVASLKNSINPWVVLEKTSRTMILFAGEGIGKVTLPGLACGIGEPAINPVPRRMIADAVSEVADSYYYQGAISITISIPGGEEIAKKTYNPRLGINGGLSILGTTGIVKPMSEKALIDTIKVEMDVQKALGADYIVVTPGNYGETFLKEKINGQGCYVVKCSNYVGETLDYAEELGFRGILFVAHMGKLTKVAAGIMNTHSSYADGRMEVLAAHAALQGAEQPLIQRIMDSVTTDNVYEEIMNYEEKGMLWSRISSKLIEKVHYHMVSRTHNTMQIELVMFSNKYGLLGNTNTLAKNLNLFIK